MTTEQQQSQQKHVLMTITVGDGRDEPTDDELVLDLAGSIHAQAMEHYGDRPGCMWAGFTSTGQGEWGNLEAMLEHLEALGCPPDERAEHEALFRGYERPIAVVHWWVVEPSVPADPGAPPA